MRKILSSPQSPSGSVGGFNREGCFYIYIIRTDNQSQFSQSTFLARFRNEGLIKDPGFLYWPEIFFLTVKFKATCDVGPIRQIVSGGSRIPARTRWREKIAAGCFNEGIYGRRLLSRWLVISLGMREISPQITGLVDYVCSWRPRHGDHPLMFGWMMRPASLSSSSLRAHIICRFPLWFVAQQVELQDGWPVGEKKTKKKDRINERMNGIGRKMTKKTDDGSLNNTMAMLINSSSK